MLLSVIQQLHMQLQNALKRKNLNILLIVECFYKGKQAMDCYITKR